MASKWLVIPKKLLNANVEPIVIIGSFSGGGGMLSNPHVIYLSAFIYVDANATGHNSLWSCLLRLDLSEVFYHDGHGHG